MKKTEGGALVLAVTGNIASGKSAFLEIWAREGVPVLSTDALAGRLVEPGSEGLGEVVRTFGGRMLTPEGSLDRARLRDLVFRDEEARRRLESILHPRIRALSARWLQEQRRRKEPLAALEIPLLFETGYDHGADEVVLVHASAAVRTRRLVEGRGLDPEEVSRIMNAQMKPEEKLKLAHHVIRNDGSRAELRAGARRLLSSLRMKTGAERK